MYKVYNTLLDIQVLNVKVIFLGAELDINVWL